MNKQNVTLSLPKSLLKKAKMVAAGRDESLSEFLKQSLESRVREETGYRKARIRQLKLLKKGFDLGTQGKITASRKELHQPVCSTLLSDGHRR